MNICRVCETKENLLCSLNDPEKSPIVQMLTDLANISYSDDDLLPKFLCQNCEKSLQLSIEFKRQCEMTDWKLRLSLKLLREEEKTAYIVEEFLSDNDMSEIKNYNTVSIKIECLEEELNEIGHDTEDIIEEFPSDNDMSEIKNYNTVSIKIECVEEDLNNIGHDTEDRFLLHSKTSEKEDQTEHSSSMQSDALKLVKKNQPAVIVDRRTCIICKMSFQSISAMKKHKKLHIDPNLTCFYCDKRFKCNNKLECHVRVQHCSTKIRTFECFDCKKEFKNRKSLRGHYKNKHSGNSYECHICLKSFTMEVNLKRHLRLVHDGLKKYKCHICHKHFGEKSALEPHLATHSDERRFQCQICDYTTKTSMALKSHNMNRHSVNLVKNPRKLQRNPKSKPKKSYPRAYKYTTCEYCGKQIRYFYYSTHIRTHTGEKPYQCKICKKSFSSNETLTSHTYTHTGEYPYKCNVCDQKFRQLAHLLCHTLTHTGEKPHQCTFCNRTFALRGNLRTHIRLHTGETPYHCTECSNRFIDLNALKRHNKKYHTKSI